jgi:hypothetical protein
MAEIYPIPYQTLSGLRDNDVTIIIRNQEFNQVSHRDGKTGICFANCYLGELEVENIVTTNIGIRAYCSIVSGALRSDKPRPRDKIKH